MIGLIRLEDAIELLESFGVYGAKEGDSGVFEVTPGEFKIESYEVLSERVYSERVKPQFWPLPLPCLFGFEPFCWVRKFAEPVIDFVINAIAVDNVDVYLLRGRITGEIVTSFFNRSEEGETWLENVKTGEQRDRHKVEGSADLQGPFSESILLKEIEEKLAEIRNTIRTAAGGAVPPDAKVEIRSTFEKTGYIDMIKNILSILLKGTIYVDDKIHVQVTYPWLGEMRTVERDIKVTAYLPVRNVRWHMW